MFHYFYISTKDRKNVPHNYKLIAGEAVPDGQEITAISNAGTVRLMDLLSDEKLAELRRAFPESKRNMKRKPNAAQK